MESFLEGFAWVLMYISAFGFSDLFLKKVIKKKNHVYYFALVGLISCIMLYFQL